MLRKRVKLIVFRFDHKSEPALVTLRETDMPYEKEWRRYFHPRKALESFGLTEGMVLLDFGCGYGTSCESQSGCSKIIKG